MSQPKLPLALLSALLLPAALAAATVEERLAELETKLDTISAENAALKKQLGVDSEGRLPTFATVAGKEKKLSVGGYVQFQGEAGDAPDSRFPLNDRFLIRRARLGVKGSFAEDIDFTFQAELGNGSLSSTANYRAQATDVFITWKKFDYANVTVGQFKTPYGYEQLISDTKTPFAERSLPNDRLTLSRQIGAMVSGDFLDKRLSYAVGAFNGNGVNNSANDNERFLTVARVSGTPLKTAKYKLTTGAGAFTTDDGVDAAAIQREGYALDAQFNAGRFDAAAEWFQTDSSPVTGADSTANGWAAHAAYFVVEKKLQTLLRYETFDANTSLADQTSESWTVGLNYFLKGDDLKLMVNYILGDPAGAFDQRGRLILRAQLIF